MEVDPPARVKPSDDTASSAWDPEPETRKPATPGFTQTPYGINVCCFIMSLPFPSLSFPSVCWTLFPLQHFLPSYASHSDLDSLLFSFPKSPPSSPKVYCESIRDKRCQCCGPGSSHGGGFWRCFDIGADLMCWLIGCRCAANTGSEQE